MGGEPCIRNLRIPVATIITMIAQGMTLEEILEYYPDLEKEDLTEALNFAAETVREREIPLTKTEWSFSLIMLSQKSFLKV